MDPGNEIIPISIHHNYPPEGLFKFNSAETFDFLTSPWSYSGHLTLALRAFAQIYSCCLQTSDTCRPLCKILNPTFKGE